MCVVVVFVIAYKIKHFSLCLLWACLTDSKVIESRLAYLFALIISA